MKNKGFIAFLIDSFICLFLSILLLHLFHEYYSQSTNIMKIIFLLAMIFIIPICLSIIIASTSGKKTLGRTLVNRNHKKKKSSKKS